MRFSEVPGRHNERSGPDAAYRLAQSRTANPGQPLRAQPVVVELYDEADTMERPAFAVIPPRPAARRSHPTARKLWAFFQWNIATLLRTRVRRQAITAHRAAREEPAPPLVTFDS